MLRPLQDRRIIGEELRVMPADHPGARTRRRDDIVIPLERFEYLQGDRLRITAVAGIVRRLATAGLCAWHLDRATRFLEQLDGGKTDRRPEEIHQAGYKERYVHGPSYHHRGPGLGQSGKIGAARPENQSVLRLSLGEAPLKQQADGAGSGRRR